MSKVTQNLLASLHKHVHVCFCKMCFTRLGYLTKLKLYWIQHASTTLERNGLHKCVVRNAIGWTFFFRYQKIDIKNLFRHLGFIYVLHILNMYTVLLNGEKLHALQIYNTRITFIPKRILCKHLEFVIINFWFSFSRNLKTWK